ncbi:hypothetical protein QMK19_03680 [Streptomyces sp. H10-C2]|uniref:hypothetical protein n=1 Tax=unclassified Streptomyces TaxID=2593676 RepID=UPI0024B95663|nr:MULTISPECIES: hypothetical protein [unclassified Streptomyces]MDJ0342288.1 hypothetical protein [Streptomyces sp. PH10-H1]MDJ0368802.1 hypothetical protein [Streptomyces sp. H10-C2]
MWLRKTTAPGAAPGGLVWTTPDDVVEVDDGLGVELLSIPGAGFSEAPAPAAEPEAGPSIGSEDSPTDPAAEVVEAPTAPPKKRATRKPAATEIAE